MEKKIGKIVNVYFGIGGYQDSQIGLHLSLGNNEWGVSDSICSWDAELIKHTQYSKWTEEDRSKEYSDIMRYLSKLLKDAKVDKVEKLKNIPIEVTFDGNILKEWRILTEVL